MELVELDTHKNGIVGLPGISGLSTEQRKVLCLTIKSTTYIVTKFSILFVKIAENSQVVDMVLLDLPCGVDHLRINSIAVW